jgi:hypothetical protein
MAGNPGGDTVTHGNSLLILRFVNTSLFALILLLTITGGLGLVFPLAGWLFALHRIAGWGLAVLTPWKAAISWRSLRRGPDAGFTRSWGLLISLLLSSLTVLVIVLALAWMWRFGPRQIRVLGYTDTLISWHWILGFILLPFFSLHAWRSWPRPKRSDFTGRRAALRIGALGAAASGAWLAGGLIARLREDPASPRRVSGSREEASFQGNDHPITTGAGDGQTPLRVEAWHLKLSGALNRPGDLTYAQLVSLPNSTVMAMLDCTVGWYTVQEWTGISLQDLLEAHGIEERALGVRVQAHSGYAHLFPFWEIGKFLLATHVNGERLAHSHGAPVRLVAPGRRGWFWVKWVTQIDVLSPPRLKQPKDG